jgi:hypothetical protein
VIVLRTNCNITHVIALQKYTSVNIKINIGKKVMKRRIKMEIDRNLRFLDDKLVLTMLWKVKWRVDEIF